MKSEEELARLWAENQILRVENEELRRQLGETQQLIEQLRLRIGELEQAGDRDDRSGHRPKPRTRTEVKGPRRKRAQEHNHGRRREAPTSTIEHTLEQCPECSYRLGGGHLDYARQVIELPPPQSVEIIEHRVIKRHCPRCERWRSPKLDLTGEVLGQGRIGVRIVSVIAYLRNNLRMGISQIQEYLATMHNLTISRGEIVELLHQVREATHQVVAELKEQVRVGSVVHADETGWRENGQNGYIWSFSTTGDDAVRYYKYDPTRAQAVVKRVLGEKKEGHLVSDFYCGYNDYAGPQQRCWVHLIRDLHELKEKQAKEAGVVQWAQQVRATYDDARSWLQEIRGPTREGREAKYVELVERTHRLGMEYTYDRGHCCQALAKRLLRHEAELFQFVLVEGLSADNNLAERSIRPMVMIRKISGGTRSDAGTKTRMALATLFQTWHVRGLNPFHQCHKLLSQPAPLSN